MKKQQYIKSDILPTLSFICGACSIGLAVFTFICQILADFHRYDYPGDIFGVTLRSVLEAVLLGLTIAVMVAAVVLGIISLAKRCSCIGFAIAGIGLVVLILLHIGGFLILFSIAHASSLATPTSPPGPGDKVRTVEQGDAIVVGTGTLIMPFPCERKIVEGLDCFYDVDGDLLLFASNSVTEVYYDEGKHPGTVGKNAFADSFQVISFITKDTTTMSDGCFGTAKVKADGRELTLRYIQFGKTVGDQVFYCTDKLSDEAFAQLQTSFSVGYPSGYTRYD